MTTATSFFYVEIIGPYDNTVFGPFSSKAHADEWRAELDVDPNVFDTYSYDHAAYTAKVAEFGPIAVERPMRFAA